ncbi:Site-specific recombinase XerD [Phyllobacterium sp. CL33Tsu]|uniref:tyrosine-type recombinase/integrase n=1 Tax=Phyllobacterium sp. CL33Tsu TaxID=1798191 RepID=UPI0008F0C4E2|nr:tyrosine-type recombinase/integrase [Phyllobacterium sp. CL33Tsu]SFJ15262.1 Site-specific recombinase XerD [Phyllobacterium sp. CL33Tsu]
MATVRPGRAHKNGSPTWRAVWFEQVNGTRRQKTKAFDKASEAKAFARRMETEVERRGVGDPDRHTVKLFLKRWLAGLKQRNELKITTIKGYVEKVELLVPHIGHIRLDRLTTRDLDEAYTTMLVSGGKSKKKKADGARDPAPLSARTVHHAHRVLHTALEQARKWRLVPENVARDAKPPSPQASKAKAFSEAEIARILEALRKAKADNKEGYPELDLVVIMLLMTGLRRSELLGLAYDAINFEARTITVRRSVVQDYEGLPILREDVVKTGASHRVISLPAAVMERLESRRAWLSEQKLLWGRDYFDGPLLAFPDAGGCPYKPDALTRRLRQVLRRAKVKGQPVHGHRHTMATHLIARSTDIKTVSSRLGHSSVAITLDLYTHALDERDRAAAETMAAVIKSATESAT